MVRKTKANKGPGWYAREWIAHKGLKQADIVARTPFNKSLVSEYVNGTRRWNKDVLDCFAEAIGVDEPGDLLRPPGHVRNELAEFLMRLDAKKQSQALRVMKSMFDDEGDGNEVKKTA